MLFAGCTRNEWGTSPEWTHAKFVHTLGDIVAKLEFVHSVILYPNGCQIRALLHCAKRWVDMDLVRWQMYLRFQITSLGTLTHQNHCSPKTKGKKYNFSGLTEFWLSLTKMMKSTEVQTLVWHGLATAVESMRESLHALYWDFLASKVRRASTSCRGKPVQICILACSFHAITFECSIFTKIGSFKNQASVAPNLLVMFIGCLVAPGGRERGNRHTNQLL